MGEKNNDSNLDFDVDAEFTKNFYKNIEKAFDDENSIPVTSWYHDASVGEKASGRESVYSEDTLEETQEALDRTLVHINTSLARQVSYELDSRNTGERKKKPRRNKVLAGTALGLSVILAFSLFLGLTGPGKKLLLKLGINLSGKIWEIQTQEFEETPAEAETAGKDIIIQPDKQVVIDITGTPNTGQSPTVLPENPKKGRHEDYAYNILLLGEEAIDSGPSNGRTDLIIIATLNTKERTVKLTSLMRDMLVQIPGFQDNKINTAYEKGGLELIYQTILKNFDIKLDGCVLVNFENFEKIIDSLGGLEITLTAQERDYLNHTNYISKPQYRNVVEGTQLMNGNQVLGYSRIRKIAAITRNNNDYGRTDRHRIILNAIFDKYKTTNKVKLASIMLELLPMLKSDIKSETFELLLNTYIDIGVTKIEQLRIPANHTFTESETFGSLEDVLIPELDKNIEILHKFIFGDIKSE